MQDPGKRKYNKAPSGQEAPYSVITSVWNSIFRTLCPLLKCKYLVELGFFICSYHSVNLCCLIQCKKKKKRSPWKQVLRRRLERSKGHQRVRKAPLRNGGARSVYEEEHLKLLQQWHLNVPSHLINKTHRPTYIYLSSAV